MWEFVETLAAEVSKGIRRAATNAEYKAIYLFRLL